MGNCSLCKFFNYNEEVQPYVQPFLSETNTNSTSTSQHEIKSSSSNNSECEKINKAPTPDYKKNIEREKINKSPTPNNKTNNEHEKINNEASKKNINDLPQKVNKSPETLINFLHLFFDERFFTNVIDFNHPNKVYTLNELNEYSSEYRMIKDLFMETNKRCYSIQKIEKVFNLHLLLQYKMKYLEYIAKNKIMIEKNMFHGTLKSNLDNICRNNFNWRLHGRNLGIRNGQGVNFTSVAYFATHYSDPGFDKVMIIANVLVGKSCQGSAAVTVPPGDYDTTIDHRQPPQVFVKYDDNTFYPAYIVYYCGNDPRHKARWMIEDDD